MLNAAFGLGGSCLPEWTARSESQEACLCFLDESVAYFLETKEGVGPPGVPTEDWAQLIHSKTMQYDGTVISKGVRMAWDLVEPALPPKQFCAVVDAWDLASGPMKDMLAQPELLLKPAEVLGKLPRKSRDMYHSGEAVKIAKGLLDRGLMAPVGPEEVPW